jgi:hypothetical protein
LRSHMWSSGHIACMALLLACYCTAARTAERPIVAMEVLKRDLPYDGGFVVVAAVGPGDVLVKVEEEGPKLLAAKEAGLEQALIGHNSDLTDAFLATLHPLQIVR